MLTQMLILTDFSPCGQLAAGHAFDVARAFGGNVTLLHVLERRQILAGSTTSGCEADPGDAEDQTTPDDAATALARLRELGRLSRRPPSCLVVPALPGVHGVASVILRVAGEVGGRTDRDGRARQLRPAPYGDRSGGAAGGSGRPRAGAGGAWRPRHPASRWPLAHAVRVVIQAVMPTFSPTSEQLTGGPRPAGPPSCGGSRIPKWGRFPRPKPKHGTRYSPRRQTHSPRWRFRCSTES